MGKPTGFIEYLRELPLDRSALERITTFQVAAGMPPEAELPAAEPEPPVPEPVAVRPVTGSTAGGTAKAAGLNQCCGVRSPRGRFGLTPYTASGRLLALNALPFV